jgi:hypothetical protein
MSISAEVAPGEKMIISLFVTGNASAILIVNAPRGEAFRRFIPEFNGTVTFRVDVVEGWGFGHGSVEAIIENETAITTLFKTFEVVCPATCLSGQVTKAISSGIQTVWIVVAATVLLALMFVGHASHVYRVDHGELSWYERFILLTRVGMRRMPDRRDFVDKTGSIPEGLQKELQELLASADRLAKMEVLVKKGGRQKRLLEAEIVIRKERLQKKAGKHFKGWRTPKIEQVETTVIPRRKKVDPEVKSDG